MLPAFPIINGQNKRANGVVDVLQQSDYDIVCFQEAFNKKAKRIIETGLKEKFPYQVNTFKKGFTMKATSGLWIISKHPIDKIAEIVYEAKKGLDGQSKKGAILLEMKTPKRIQIVNTHLQSGSDGGRHEVRKSQCEQIRNELIQKHINPEIPLVLLGDWNVYEGSSFSKKSILELYDITDSSNEMIDYTWPSESFSGEDKPKLNLDFIFLKDTQNDFTDLKSKIPNLKYQWKRGKYDLSDHLPVEAVLKY